MDEVLLAGLGLLLLVGFYAAVVRDRIRGRSAPTYEQTLFPGALVVKVGDVEIRSLGPVRSELLIDGERLVGCRAVTLYLEASRPPRIVVERYLHKARKSKPREATEIVDTVRRWE